MKLEYNNDEEESSKAQQQAPMCPRSPRSLLGRSKRRSLRDVFKDAEEEKEEPLVAVEFHDDNDGRVTYIEVPEGTKITEAATMAGVYIVSEEQMLRKAHYIFGWSAASNVLLSFVILV